MEATCLLSASLGQADGGRLEMLWRYEQYFYENWASGLMTRAGTTGLIRVDIRP